MLTTGCDEPLTGTRGWAEDRRDQAKVRTFLVTDLLI